MGRFPKQSVSNRLFVLAVPLAHSCGSEKGNQCRPADRRVDVVVERCVVDVAEQYQEHHRHEEE